MALASGPTVVAGQLATIAKVANHIRLKAIGVCPQSTKQILKFAAENDMTVMAGLSISGDDERDSAEFDMLKAIVGKYDESVISHVIVGDELVFDLGVRM